MLFFVIGGLSVGVPGLVKGLWTVHKKHGNLRWSELVEPAIKLAEGGFLVTKPVAAAIKRAMTKENNQISAALKYIYFYLTMYIVCDWFLFSFVFHLNI